MMPIAQKVNEVNAVITKQPWYDFEVLEWKRNNLTIIGSEDFSFFHTLEIVFEDVFHVSLNSEWKSDTSKPVFMLAEGDEARSLNLKYQVEQGYQIFKFVPEYLEETPFYIVAKNISLSTCKVYYFKVDNLGENERIADWVK